MDAGKGNKEGDGQKHGQEVGGGMIVAVKRKVLPTKPTRSSARLRNQWLPFEVFDNELLRKKILGCAVFSGGNKEEYRKTACSLRLVGKTWNETVIKLFYKRQEPLIIITLYAGGMESGKLLGRFSKIFSASIPINGFIPPFSLHKVYVGSGNLKAFLNLLTHCGEGLVQLNIGWSPSWLCCQSEFPNMSLPRLGKLEIYITCEANLVPREVTSGQDDKGTLFSCLLNSIRRDVISIAEFKMALTFTDRLPVRKSQLTGLPLPMTITNLDLLGSMRVGDVEVLAGKPLPNLTSLTLSLQYDLLGNGSFFRILDNYRASLKMLTIQDYLDPLGPGEPILIRFPIMETLEELYFNSTPLELEHGLISLGMSFPKLRSLCLYYQTDTKFRKWTENAKFISVAKLQFSLWNDQSLNMETMQSVNFALPNVRDLDLSFSGTEMSGLKYIFREMTQLTTLKLKYCGSEPEVNSDFWDALLTGIPLETIAESRQDPGFWERFEMNEEEQLGSVRNLKELTSLALCWYWESNQSSIISVSDITFQHALLKMPNLQMFYLRGRFKASAQMAEVWKSGGRLLEYSLYVSGTMGE